MATTCPICRKAARPREENQTFPFCGERCRMADLGSWLSEDYRIPTDEVPDGDGGPSAEGVVEGSGRRPED
jgi:endogenous inhibitor of DNA gyrase (YacG/DUF329 family)